MKARRSRPGPAIEPEHTIPAVHALHLCELVTRWQISAPELLAPLKLTAQALAEPGARLSLAQLERLCERAILLTGEPGLGFYMGLQMRISTHGYLGFAAMTAETLREAIALAIRFAPTRTTALSLRLHVEADTASLIVDEQAQLGRSRELLIYALLIGLWQIACAITGRELSGFLEVRFPQPDYFVRFAQLARGMIRFDRPLHGLTFDAALLDLPLVMADKVAQQLAQQHCEKELDALSFSANLAARAGELLPLDAGGFRSAADLAKKLHLSLRTLKRRLAAEGTSYFAILDDLRQKRALLLLREGNLSAEQVAAQLGYSDAANFTRAFRRWTGTTPRRFRRELRQP